LTTAPEGERPLKRFGGEAPPAPDWFHWAVAQEPERSAVEVEGAAIETLAWGQRGRPGLLLLHGGWAHADWWSFIAPFLAEDYRVATLSWSGMGGSGWRESYSLQVMVEEAMATAEWAGLFDAGKPVIAGHSFGGHMALACAANVGERLKAAATIDTVLRLPSPDSRPRREARENRIYPTFEAAVANFRFMPRQGVENLYLADFIARRSLKEVTDPKSGERGWTWKFDPFMWHHFMRGNGAEMAASAKCPLATFWGGRSTLTVPIRDQAAQVMPPGTPSVVIPDADHHVLVDQPLALIAALKTFAAMS
jgi:pimeloyl-ACP methyl ester carboxylesterase